MKKTSFRAGIFYVTVFSGINNYQLVAISDVLKNWSAWK
ncbi:hypothetical protein M23134_05472 [Microscilla marina ATCC 23134]|uniref:Uncharacterized protein n=1 Tax=Microscilla marina ATCC 23134 TaxID=313606 RepID=A1ZHY2_MICM2|nr:hypothetical protein M23134_05472 [Microscilla marina ATCC 23134]